MTTVGKDWGWGGGGGGGGGVFISQMFPQAGETFGRSKSGETLEDGLGMSLGETFEDGLQ